MKRKILIGFLVIVGLIVFSFLAISTRVYPVATVNNGFISAGDFERVRQAAERYYNKLIPSPSEQLDGVAIRQVALQALIEDMVVTQELERRYEAASLKQATQERVATALTAASSTIEKAVSELFGVSVEDFIGMVLAPAARVEMLSADLVTEGILFDAWLNQALQLAEVSIALNDLKWQNGQVALTGEQPYTAKVQELFEQIASTSQALEAASSTSTQP